MASQQLSPSRGRALRRQAGQHQPPLQRPSPCRQVSLTGKLSWEYRELVTSTIQGQASLANARCRRLAALAIVALASVLIGSVQLVQSVICNRLTHFCLSCMCCRKRNKGSQKSDDPFAALAQTMTESEFCSRVQLNTVWTLICLPQQNQRTRSVAGGRTRRVRAMRRQETVVVRIRIKMRRVFCCTSFVAKM